MLPWLVIVIWLIGTLIAFWYFEIRLPPRFWCGGDPVAQAGPAVADGSLQRPMK